MSKLKERAFNIAGKIYTKFSGVAQEKTEREKEDKSVTAGMPPLLRRAAAEGAVLLKNDGVLPLKNGACVSLFGRVQCNWFYTGYGSGGDVNRPYAVNLLDGIRACDALRLNENLAEIYEKWCAEHVINDAVWGMWPRFYPEMPITRDLAARAENNSDCAVVTIGRSSGEDRDSALEKGSYYLTDDERNMLDLVTAYFDKTVVLLNIGAIIDFSWIAEYGDKIGAVMIVWQGGMESGNAAADLLCGKTNPCGKLTDAVGRDYDSYPSSKYYGNKEFNYYTEDIYVGYRYFETFSPSDVLYPFGFGLSYTDFAVEFEKAEPTANGFDFALNVENTGSFAGKEAPQLYVEKPCGVLGNPKRELAAFAKTALLNPNECENIRLSVSLYQLASYDSSKSAYVIESGRYNFYLGTDVHSAKCVYSYYQQETAVYQQLSECAAPKESFEVVNAVEGEVSYLPIKRNCRTATVDLRKRIIANLPKAEKISCDLGYKLSDVKSGKISMGRFVAQLSVEELEAITRGDYTMNSSLGAEGNAGAFGGVLLSLREKGVPAAVTTDGPSGIRLKSCCSLIPIGTLLACTFDERLVEEVYSAVASEMKEKGSDVLLAPGMNIHRNPLCGRNFEYYSEDPYLTGKIGAAAVRGIQSKGGSACPKHFACNNQEYKRTTNDSRVSERALREIYLKGFEICIKEAAPKNLMTSYNKVNGVWSHYHYDLCTSVLRNEWGYAGNVMTDWWMQSSKSPEFPKMRDQAYRVRAQVDVLMPGGARVGSKKPDGTLLKTLGDEDGITLGELQRSAGNVLNFIMQNKL